ncbi:DsbA family protein [Candidatus Falkowbacteria bacterium]|nr:DsbA family protein [Candidatus Falkowbacteria bacterium]
MKKNIKNKQDLLLEEQSGWQSRFNALIRTNGRGPRRWYHRWWGILLLVIASLFSLLVAIYLYKVAYLVWQLKTGQITVAELMLEQNNQGLNAKELIALSKGPAPYYLGTSSPQVLIVEYGDFNCSHCRVVSPTIRKVVSQNKDIVQYVWRDWPGQNNSELLAQAARCAGEQAGSLGFWLFHDQLLLNQSQFTTTSQLMDLAQEYSLSDTKLKDCLDQQRTLGYLQKDYQDAIALGGIAGTPTWFINGYRFSGELPAEFFNYMIKELTKNK